MGSHIEGKPLTTSDYLSWHLIDLPGHGKTKQDAGLQDLLDYLDGLQTPFHLVGYSMGGRVAQKLAFHPNCRSLTLMSSHTLFDTQELEERMIFEGNLKKQLETLPLRDFVANFYSSSLFSSLKRRKRLFEAYLLRREQLDKESLKHALDTLSVETLKSNLPTCPVLGLYGMLDLKYQKLYAKLPPSVNIATVPSSGHVVHLENTTFCIKILEQFIRDIDNDMGNMRTL